MDEPITRAIPVTVSGLALPTVWAWYADIPDTITMLFVHGGVVTPWRVPVEVLHGVPAAEGMTVVYLDDEALIHLTGVDDNGADQHCVLHASAVRLEQFYHDIQAARLAPTAGV
jgi:hypothetical protein